MRRALAPAWAALALACTDPDPGRLLAAGAGRGIAVAPGGGAVAFLVDARHPDDRGVPDDLLAGDLYLASGDEPARRVGGGVSSGTGAYAFSSGGTALAFLGGYRFRAGAGELYAASLTGAPQKLADDAHAFAWAPQGERLAWAAADRLWVLDAPGAPPRPLVDGAWTFAWSPDGRRLAVRGPSTAGARLLLVDAASGERRAVAEGVTDFAFGADGTLAALGPPGPRGGDRPLWVLEPGAAGPRAAGRATSFVLAPGGDVLASSTEKAPGEATGDLFRLPPGGGEPRLLGVKSVDVRCTPAGDVLFLGRYDVKARAGVLTLARAAGPVREIAARVQGFLVGPRGERVFYLVQKPLKGDFKFELWAADLRDGAPTPRKIDQGVYGYEPSPDGALLYWRARCGLGPRSCSLFRGPADGSGPGVELAKDVAGFDLSGDGARLLLGAPHRGSSRAVDLSWISAATPPGKARPIAAEVDPSARFLDGAGKRAVFARLTRGKAAVFIAELR